MDTSTKKLLSGSLVYFVGNALTQFISLLLMPFVTGNISPEEYGFFNLVTTISNLVIPFVTLQIADAVFRFVLRAESEAEKKSYFTICFIVSLVSVSVIFAAVFTISLFVEIPYALLVALFVSFNAVYGIFQKIIRSLNRNTVLVSGNLLKTLIFLVLEICLISALDMGLEALYLAHILSFVFFFAYSEMQVHTLKYFDLCSLRGATFRKMIRFSAPLIPNAAFWWLTSSVNHVIVSAKLGVGVNGIYSVSGKFSSVLNMVTSVLNMSWQDTAIADYGSKGFSTFLTKTFNSFVTLIFSAITVIIPLVSITLPYLIDPAYYTAIPYTPFLLLAAGASAMSGFVAQIFTGRGKNESILVTSFLGMIANIAIVTLFVGKIGLWAAVLGSLAADTVLFGSRTFLARKEFAKGINFKRFCFIFVLLVVSIYLYLCTTATANMVWFFVTLLFAIFLNREFVFNIFSLVFGQVFKKSTKEEAE